MEFNLIVERRPFKKRKTHLIVIAANMLMFGVLTYYAAEAYRDGSAFWFVVNIAVAGAALGSVLTHVKAYARHSMADKA